MTDPVDTAPLLIDDEDESVVEPAAITAPPEALLLMATEPMPTAELAQAVRAPVALVERALAHLAEFYDETGRGFEPKLRGRRLAVLDARRARRTHRRVVDRGSTRQAVAGRPRNPGGGGLPAADLTQPGVGRPRGERRRRAAHPGHPRPGTRPTATSRPARCCSAPRANSWSGSDWPG